MYRPNSKWFQTPTGLIPFSLLWFGVEFFFWVSLATTTQTLGWFYFIYITEMFQFVQFILIKND